MERFFEQHRVVLAPMAGVSDAAFRKLCIEQGAALGYTEMVSAKGLSYGNEKTRELLRLSPDEESVAVQLFGHEPLTMAREAARVADHLQNSLACIDINMGCPARKIVKKGDGCALMQQPDLARRIIGEVAQAVEGAVTVKFRRGFSLGDEAAVPFARMAEEAGAAAVAVHGRYAEQLYRGKADWDVILQVKAAVSIPVIGNGDIRCGGDARAMSEHTGCDAVMIGRAARGNPWLFAAAQAALEGRKMPAPPLPEQKIAMALRHARLLSEREGENIVRMRKHAMWYCAGLPLASAARHALDSCITLKDFEQVFDAVSETLSGLPRYPQAAVFPERAC